MNMHLICFIQMKTFVALELRQATCDLYRIFPTSAIPQTIVITFEMNKTSHTRVLLLLFWTLLWVFKLQANYVTPGFMHRHKTDVDVEK